MSNGDDRTVFLQESVSGGYVHQLIGSPDDDFAQDVYILSSGCCDTSMDDPFGRGTGAANPTRVIIRQRVRDSESINEFLKDTLQAKPVITSIINDGQLLNTFIADMSGISYQDSVTAANITITNEFIDPSLDTEFRPDDFDFSTDVQTSGITGGRFIYSSGSYDYIDGSDFNLSGINWASFCNPTQNLNASDASTGGWGSGGADYCEGGNTTGGSSGSGGWGW